MNEFNKEEYNEKISMERQWYTDFSFKKDHPLNSRLFFSPERNAFNYIFPKKQLSNMINQIANEDSMNNPSMLIAPIGTGDDLKYIRHLSSDISGIDVSREAVEKITDKTINTYVGDMKNMTMFKDNQFDIMITSLFFHHFVKHGFDDFLDEAYRVLKPGGYFFSLEPSSLYPIHLITRYMKKIVGNISGAVEDEMPFNPKKLSNAMKRCGFHNVTIKGASFSYHRIPILIAKLNNIITLPLLKIPFLKNFAFMCLFYGKK